MKWRLVVGVGALSVVLGCGGKETPNAQQGAGASGVSGAGPSSERGGAGSDISVAGVAGTGGTSGSSLIPPGCPSGILGQDRVCVSAADAWAWANGGGAAGSGNAAGGGGGTGAGAAKGGTDSSGGDAVASEGGVGGGGDVPEGCPRSYKIRDHVTFMYSTLYDGGERMGAQCCYSSFQPCG